MHSPEPITVTQTDLERLTTLLRVGISGPGALCADALDGELARARVVGPKEVSPDVVTMNSRVRFVDGETRQEREVTLVYPHEADSDRGHISVLSPLGSALLGMSAGRSIDWVLPNGRRKTFSVLEVSYQPEASGEWDR